MPKATKLLRIGAKLMRTNERTTTHDERVRSKILRYLINGKTALTNTKKPYPSLE